MFLEFLVFIDFYSSHGSRRYKEQLNHVCAYVLGLRDEEREMMCEE